MAGATWPKVATAQESGSSPQFTYPGGRGIIVFGGSFGGGTAKIEISVDAGATWQVLTDNAGQEFATTKPANFTFDLPSMLMRITISGATGGAVTAYICPRPLNA